MLTIANSPSKQAAYTNQVYLSIADLDKYKSRAPDQGLGDAKKVLLYLSSGSGDWVFTAVGDGKMDIATLGVSTLQRRTAQLELGQRVEVIPFRPEPRMALVSMDISVSLMQPGRSIIEFDALSLEEYFKKEYLCQVFAIGQKLAIAFKRNALELEIQGLEFGADLEKKKSSSSLEKEKSRFGQLIKPSRCGFRVAEDYADKLRLKNAHKAGTSSKQAVQLFNSDFDFGKLGIGGLQGEFNIIFRRAFASRIYPSHIIQQMGISHVRGMLLHGPPGCGKTLIARKIGKALNAREPKIVNGPEILDKYVGASEEKIRELFADAEAEQKKAGDDSMLHIIIFDEMDAICKQRGSVRDGTGVSDSIVNQLLSKIDGVDSLNNILVIGMTNRKDMIDEAILRPGRLELHVEIGLPDEAGRLQILEIKTASMRESNRLTKQAEASLPQLAKKTKNFSGAEIEGLVKSAASYALRRCVDVSKGMELNEQALQVTENDFNTAIESGEIQPAFGVNTESLEALYRNGIINYGSALQEAQDSLNRLVDQVRNSAKTPLMTVLLTGESATGKTALAAATAVHSKYPFIRLLSADSVIGYSESSKSQHIHKLFLDSYKSPLSLLLIDDIERLIEYTPIGPRFSNTVLQTLLVLLKKIPAEEDRRLLVICTTALPRHTLKDLEFIDVFNVILHLPKLSAPDEITKVLANHSPAAPLHDLQTVAAAITRPIGIKHLLMVAEMAKASAAADADTSPRDSSLVSDSISLVPSDTLDINQFLFCLHSVAETEDFANFILFLLLL